MTNQNIAQNFKQLAQLLELQGQNPFKTRAYLLAAKTIEQLPRPLAELSPQERRSLEHIGPAIADKIQACLQLGYLPQLRQAQSELPPQLPQLLQIPNLGIKKIRTLWQELDIESAGELHYACMENRLLKLKGFGPKSQAQLLEASKFWLQGRDQAIFRQAQTQAQTLLQYLQPFQPAARWIGALDRRDLIVQQYDLQLFQAPNPQLPIVLAQLGFQQEQEHYYIQNQGPALKIHPPKDQEHSPAFLRLKLAGLPNRRLEQLQKLSPHWPQESDYLQALGLNPQLPPWAWRLGQLPPDLIQKSDIKGLVHVHSQYSDGQNDLKTLALRCQELGFQYLGISDHSQTAVYAQGLKPQRVREQAAEIAELNRQLAPFRIYHGIESDVLADGSLDYDDQTLAQFDFVIASVHSGLRMNREQATQRLLKAIAHPATTILGHPTGRLLLSRQGYELHWPQIFEACAKHQVAIELNANPRRMDLDPQYIQQAQEAGVKIAIQPDAHNLKMLEDWAYGFDFAQQAGLRRPFLFDLQEYLAQKT